MFELICVLVVLVLVVLAIVGWIEAIKWKNRYYEMVDECQYLDLQMTQLRQQLYGERERKDAWAATADELLEQASQRQSETVQHQCTAAAQSVGDGLVESAVIAAATDNAMLGGLVGGNVLGGVLGELLHDSNERQVVEAAEPLVVDGETIVEAGDRLEIDGDRARVLDAATDAADDSYSSSSDYGSSDYSSADSGSSDSGFSSSDW